MGVSRCTALATTTSGGGGVGAALLPQSSNAARRPPRSKIRAAKKRREGGISIGTSHHASAASGPALSCCVGDRRSLAALASEIYFRQARRFAPDSGHRIPRLPPTGPGSAFHSVSARAGLGRQLPVVLQGTAA